MIQEAQLESRLVVTTRENLWNQNRIYTKSHNWPVRRRPKTRQEPTTYSHVTSTKNTRYLYSKTSVPRHAFSPHPLSLLLHHSWHAADLQPRRADRATNHSTPICEPCSWNSTISQWHILQLPLAPKPCWDTQCGHGRLWQGWLGEHSRERC